MRVLVSKDNLINQYDEVRILWKEGLKPIAVAAAERTRDGIKHLRFDTLVTDAQMPVFDHLEST